MTTITLLDGEHTLSPPTFYALTLMQDYGVDFDSVDGRPTRLFFVLVAPQWFTEIHLKALARISRLCKEPGFRGRLLVAGSSQEMYDILCEEDK